MNGGWTNSRTIRPGLRDRLMAPEIAPEAMRAYAEETNRLNRERRASGDGRAIGDRAPRAASARGPTDGALGLRTCFGISTPFGGRGFPSGVGAHAAAVPAHLPARSRGFASAKAGRKASAPTPDGKPPRPLIRPLGGSGGIGPLRRRSHGPTGLNMLRHVLPTRALQRAKFTRTK